MKRSDYIKYKNKFKVGDYVGIVPNEQFTYWSLDNFATYRVVATVGWNRIQIQNCTTMIVHTSYYNTRNFKIKDAHLTAKFDTGDIVRKAQESSSYWAKPSTLKHSTDYIVVDRQASPTSGKNLYRLQHVINSNGNYTASNSFDHSGTWYAENNLKMYKKGIPLVTANIKAIILDEAGATVGTVATHDANCNVLTTDEEVSAAIDQKVGDLLRKNPTKAYRVFTYSKTGKLPVLPVTWE